MESRIDSQDCRPERFAAGPAAAAPATGPADRLAMQSKSIASSGEAKPASRTAVAKPANSAEVNDKELHNCDKREASEDDT